MKAIRVHAPGGPEAMQLDEIPAPKLEPGQAIVHLEASGVNFIDVFLRTGLYPSQAPFTLGSEGAGTVTAVADGVTAVRVGDRVAFSGVRGTYAELIAVPADRLVVLPDDITTRQGAALMLQGLTAQYLATSTYSLREGEWCLVHAAAGGVGLLLCQIARNIGAHVIGTTSTDQKAKLARDAGAEEVILYTKQDFEAETRRITDGAGVSVVYDSVGRTTFEQSLRSLRRRGMLVLFGQSSGPVPPVDLQLLSRNGSLYATRPTLADYIATREELLARSDDLFRWIREGRLHVRIDREIPLADAAEAHRLLESRATAGKLLLIP